MSDNFLNQDTQKLIRCCVINKFDETSTRFVLMSDFGLWEHLMVSKHGATINNVSLCLWVNEEEFIRNENIYQHADNLFRVDRIVVDLFDDEYGFSNATVRYVASEESDQVIKIILSHIPEDRKTAELCQVNVEKGTSIEQIRRKPSREMLLGIG